MKKLFTIILLAFSVAAHAQEVATVDFQNDNEQDVINYVLQYDQNGWQDVKTIAKGQDYSFEIPFKPGLYRLKVHQKSNDYFTRIVILRADEMSVRIEVKDQILLHIASPKFQQAKITLYDFAARVIVQKEVGLTRDENTITLQKPASGLYVLNIIGNQSTFNQEIIVK